MLHTLLALSPLDGRYHATSQALSHHFSEFGLIKARVRVELMWLQALAAAPDVAECPPLSDAARELLDGCLSSFNLNDAETIKRIEQRTHHDVKAVEYFVRDLCTSHEPLAPYATWVHFGCTSADINNLAYGVLMQDALKDVLRPAFDRALDALKDHAKINADLPMLARTHGQPASPTTLGGEMMVYVRRLSDCLQHLDAQTPLTGKCNGAVGRFNAHVVAYPNVDWPKLSAKMVSSLGLKPLLQTTQIEPHDHLGHLHHAMMSALSVCLDAARDFWGYISLGYFVQAHDHQQVGSSTMPHKVNPIHFENAEGNIGLANALLSHMNLKLPVSRFQRDLSDSTVMRNIGVAWGHALLALTQLTRGLVQCTPNPDALRHDLDQHWEVLGEAVQTVMRKHGLDGGYEWVKSLTQGRVLDQAGYVHAIQSLDIPNEDKERLLALTPETYTGMNVNQA